ncbi:MAG: hypothetical protein HYV94_20160 [Candidatus Rokubacteria bacterium]|nr:hypothetical protein [Candidatus Rokubacteria bacterium]MBI4627080.1 hypothetical protein [Candidatus Rokubacteria bacterium]
MTDYSPWEGWSVTGWPVLTVLRGKVIVDHGRLLTRKIDPAVLQRPVC